MDAELVFERLYRPVHPVWVAAAGAGILIGLFTFSHLIGRATEGERIFQNRLSVSLEQSVAARDRMSSLEGLKRRDLDQLKAGISGHAQSEKSLFESGLSLQEERRLLDKQLEIMTTYLLVDPDARRIYLMRSEQPLQSYRISYVPVRALGGASAALPAVVRIVSKERFANPERGRSEEVNGRLQWVPPQVGTSIRSKALGEFVMFTNSALILHGPPLDIEDHEHFPHVCLGLDREAARKLYRSSFIGTKISLQHLAIETPAAPVHLTADTTVPTSVDLSTPAVTGPGPGSP
jgi:hypothetical protein